MINHFNFRYKNKDQLVRHVQTHEKPQIQCLECHRVFGRPDHLKRHVGQFLHLCNNITINLPHNFITLVHY